MTSVPRGRIEKNLRHENFGLSDASEYSSRGSNQSCLQSYDASAQHDDVSHRNDVNDSLRIHRGRINSSYCGDRSAVINVGTAQEEQDRNVFRSAPENKP